MSCVDIHHISEQSQKQHNSSNSSNHNQPTTTHPPPTNHHNIIGQAAVLHQVSFSVRVSMSGGINNEESQSSTPWHALALGENHESNSACASWASRNESGSRLWHSLCRQSLRHVDEMQPAPLERIHECFAEQGVDFPVPRTMEEIADGVQSMPQERVPNFTAAQFGDVPVPQVQEQILQVFKVVPQQRRRIKNKECPCRKAKRISLMP